VVTSVVGEGDSIANTPASIKELMETFLRGSTRDKAGMEDVVRASGLDWIITRPPVLNDEPATGDVRVLTAQSGELAHSITRADLATFIVAQLTNNDHLQHAVTIANR